MARKQFTLNTDPHVADMGPLGELHFVPEVFGDQYLDAYAELQAAQETLGADGGDMSKLTGDKLRSLYTAIRTYLTKMMVEESAERFSHFEVTQGGKTAEVFRSRAEADEFAAGLGAGARVVDKSMRLPDRVLIELMEWSIELYGGGQKRPTGRSKGSSTGSRTTGTRGKAPSRSKA